MAPFHVATLTVKRELPKYQLVSRVLNLPYPCTNMAPHFMCMATLADLAYRVSTLPRCINNETMAPLFM